MSPIYLEFSVNDSRKNIIRETTGNCKLNLTIVKDLLYINLYGYVLTSAFFNYLVNVTAGGPDSPWGHMLPSSTVDCGWFVAFWGNQIFLVKKFIEIVIVWDYYTIPSGLTLFWHS